MSVHDAFLSSYRKDLGAIKDYTFSRLGFVDRQVAELSRRKVEFFANTKPPAAYKAALVQADKDWDKVRVRVRAFAFRPAKVRDERLSVIKKSKAQVTGNAWKKTLAALADTTKRVSAEATGA